jgi:hypothetical protein
VRKFFSALVCLFIVSCGAGGGIPPQTVTDVTVGVNAALCVMDTYSADITAGKTEVQAIADAAIKCGLQVVQVTGILDHAKAMQVKDAGVE